MKFVSEEYQLNLPPSKEGAGATPRDPKIEFLSEIIERMNELFIEDGLSEKDMINYANTIAGKVSENDVVMEQLRSNTKEQAMLGQFPQSITKAVIDSISIHETMARKVLSNYVVAKNFAKLMFDMLMKDLGKDNH